MHLSWWVENWLFWNNRRKQWWDSTLCASLIFSQKMSSKSSLRGSLRSPSMNTASSRLAFLNNSTAGIQCRKWQICCAEMERGMWLLSLIVFPADWCFAVLKWLSGVVWSCSKNWPSWNSSGGTITNSGQQMLMNLEHNRSTCPCRQTKSTGCLATSSAWQSFIVKIWTSLTPVVPFVPMKYSLKPYFRLQPLSPIRCGVAIK